MRHALTAAEAAFVREELALEIDRVLRDLELRREVLRDIWSLHRDRGGFVDTTHARYDRLNGRQLLALSTDAAACVDAFHRRLSGFRLYLASTDDMPATLFETYDRATASLERIGRIAIDHLGGVPERQAGSHPAHEDVLRFFRVERKRPVLVEEE